MEEIKHVQLICIANKRILYMDLTIPLVNNLLKYYFWKLKSKIRKNNCNCHMQIHINYPPAERCIVKKTVSAI